MLITPHVLVGAAIGTEFNHGYLVAPVAAASHFVLDFIPHWDLRIDLDHEDLERQDIVIVILDLVTSTCLLTLLLFHNPNWELMLVGAISAAVPDVHHVIRVLSDPKRWERFARLGRIHTRYSKIHTKFNWDQDSRFIYGMLTQILVGLAAILTIIRF